MPSVLKKSPTASNQPQLIEQPTAPSLKQSATSAPRQVHTGDSLHHQGPQRTRQQLWHHNLPFLNLLLNTENISILFLCFCNRLGCLPIVRPSTAFKLISCYCNRLHSRPEQSRGREAQEHQVFDHINNEEPAVSAWLNPGTRPMRRSTLTAVESLLRGYLPSQASPSTPHRSKYPHFNFSRVRRLVQAAPLAAFAPLYWLIQFGPLGSVGARLPG